MKKREAIRQFNALWSQACRNNPGMKNDKPAKLESWGCFIDVLARDGKITPKQYATWTL